MRKLELNKKVSLALIFLMMFSFGVLQILPSPTTGSFSVQAYDWKNSSGFSQPDVKREVKSHYSDFSFQPQPLRAASSYAVCS